jgi:hypothetical protein
MERFEQSGSLNIDLNNEKETVSTEYLDAKYSVVRNPEKGLDEKERVQEHKHKVLRPKCLRIKRSHFTFFDYQTEWASHPEWHKKSNSEAQNKEGAKSGLGAFYKSLLGFAQKESNGDEEKRRKIIEQFFPSNFTYRASLMYRGHYTLQDYQTEWNSHPEWYGKLANSFLFSRSGATKAIISASNASFRSLYFPFFSSYKVSKYFLSLNNS